MCNLSFNLLCYRKWKEHEDYTQKDIIIKFLEGTYIYFILFILLNFLNV